MRSVTTRQHHIEVRGIPVEVVRKNIKNLHLRVYPPHGRVRIAAPLRLNDDAVRLAIISNFDWILRKRDLIGRQPRQSRLEMVTGESHYFLGRQFCLHVHAQTGPARVVLNGDMALELFVRPEASAGQRYEVLLRWYRDELKALIPPLLEKWQTRIGESVAEWGIKKMKTRWGSCNPRARRVWFSLELAKKHPQCLEYVVVHELVHLLERSHNDRFRRLMDRFMPEWRLHRAALNRAPAQGQCARGATV
jgi:predicted metal-dependent hydrolase